VKAKAERSSPRRQPHKGERTSQFMKMILISALWPLDALPVGSLSTRSRAASSAGDAVGTAVAAAAGNGSAGGASAARGSSAGGATAGCSMARAAGRALRGARRRASRASRLYETMHCMARRCEGGTCPEAAEKRASTRESSEWAEVRAQLPKKTVANAFTHVARLDSAWQCARGGGRGEGA